MMVKLRASLILAFPFLPLPRAFSGNGDLSLGHCPTKLKRRRSTAWNSITSLTEELTIQRCSISMALATADPF
jgi:hypothetical protein